MVHVEELPVTKRTTEAAGHQRVVVEEHFRNVSQEWGTRYRRAPQRMSDLDMLLRKENVERLLRPLLDGADGRLQILDVGCGSGDVLDVVQDCADVISIDLVPEMVVTAAHRNPGGRFLVADAAQLPLSRGCVDVVTCIGVLEYLPDPAKALTAMYEVLRPGGSLIISFPNGRSWFRILSRLESSFERFAVGVRNRLLGRDSNGPAAPRYRHQRWTVGQATRLLTASGLQVRDLRFNTYGSWGRSGRTRAALRWSAWMSKRFNRRGSVSSLLACTCVVWAMKQSTPIGESVHP